MKLQALFLTAVLAGSVFAKKENTNNIASFNFIKTGIVSAKYNVNTFSLGYEHHFAESGYAIQTPIFLGFEREKVLENSVNEAYEDTYAIGGGIVLKKYLKNEQRGGYPFFSAVGVYGKAKKRNSYFNQVAKYEMKTLIDVGVGYGYLWKWNYFTLDVNLGGAIVKENKEIKTGLIGDLNVGFPF